MQENKNIPLVEEEINFYNDPRKRSAHEAHSEEKISLWKIGNITSIMLVIAATIGSGIFHTNGELFKMAKGDMYFVIASWAISILGMVALAFALLEIVSAQKTNRGILGWTKYFTFPWFHDSVKKYFRLVYIPMTLYAVTLLSTQFMQDAGWRIDNGYLVALLAFGLMTIFMVVNLVSFQASVILQWFLKVGQIIVLVVVPIMAFMNAGEIDNFMIREVTTSKVPGQIEAATGFAGVSKWMVLWSGIPIIAYSFEGFYIPASLRDSHKTISQNGRSIWIGVVIIASLYAFFSIGMIVGSTDGTVFGVGMASWLNTAINIIIAAGVLTIANGFMMGALRQMQSSLQGSFKTYDIKNTNLDMKFLHNLIFGRSFMYNTSIAKKTFITSWIYLYTITTIMFMAFTPIGLELYYNVDAAEYSPIVEAGLDAYGTTWFLYRFSSSMISFVCQFMLAIIATVLVGGLLNRKKNFVKTIQYKFFVPLAIIAIIPQYLGFLYLLIATFSDASGAFGSTGFQQYDAIIQIVIFIVVTTLVFGISILNEFITKAKAR